MTPYDRYHVSQAEARQAARIAARQEARRTIALQLGLGLIGTLIGLAAVAILAAAF